MEEPLNGQADRCIGRHATLDISKRSAWMRRTSEFKDALARLVLDRRGNNNEMSSASSLKSIRLIHHYTGVFFAPTILFFAITGGLQMFGLHETSRGSSYVPSAILVHLSQLHKKGSLYLPPRKQAPPTPAKLDGQKADTLKPDTPKPAVPTPVSPAPNPLPMKLFFAATALALVVSTFTGLSMSWKYARRKAVVVGVLVAGVVCPLILLLL